MSEKQPKIEKNPSNNNETPSIPLRPRSRVDLVDGLSEKFKHVEQALRRASDQSFSTMDLHIYNGALNLLLDIQKEIFKEPT